MADGTTSKYNHDRVESLIAGYCTTNAPNMNIIHGIILIILKYYFMDVFDPNKQHDHYQTSNNGLTATKEAVSGTNTYGLIEIDSKDQRQYQWTISIINRGSGMILGIASNPDPYKDKWRTIDYGYNAFNGQIFKSGSHHKYGIKIHSGGSLMIRVDFQNKCIGFTANGKDLGMAFQDIIIGPIYYLAASMNSKDACITISDFKCIGQQ